MIEENHQKIKVRMNMVQELLELDAEASLIKNERRSTSDAQMYGMAIVFVASFFVILFAGKPNQDVTTLLGLQGMLLGGFFVFAIEFSLADRLSGVVKLLLSFVKKT